MARNPVRKLAERLMTEQGRGDSIERATKSIRSLIERESRKREEACGRWMYFKGRHDARKNIIAPDSSLNLYRSEYRKSLGKSKPRQGGR